MTDQTAGVVQADVLLADGSTVHIRQVEPGDAERVAAMHERLSERTRYLRYFSAYPRIPPRTLARFVTVDHHDREALVVEVENKIIAIGQYERLGPGAPDAEVAFTVEDPYQGRGIGSVLLEHLAARAASAGITRFVAEVLPANQAMLRVFRDAGYEVNRRFVDGVVHLTFAIAPTARSIEVQRRREQKAEAASIARLLSPRSVAVYGIRRDGTGFGSALLRHLLAGGYTGAVYPIHPEASTVAGLPAFRTATQAPGPVDLALVAVPAERVQAIIEDAARAGAHAAVVASAGFAEVGNVELQRRLVDAARAMRLRLVGPNALGIANSDPAIRLNASLAPRLSEPGRVGLFCQSAAMSIAMLAEADARGIRLSTFVSAGNRADVSGNDLLQYWRDDPHTDVVLLYLETFGNPRKFARIARELGQTKPIVAVTAGSAASPSPDGREAMDALIAHSGVIRVDTIPELFDVASVLATQPLPAGNRVGVVGNVPSLAALARDACTRAGLVVPVPPRIVAQDGPPSQLIGAVRDALDDDAVDTVFVVTAPRMAGIDSGDTIVADQARALATAAAGADKPVVAALVGMAAGDPRPTESGVACFETVEAATRALAHVARYAAWRREPRGTVPDLSGVDSVRARAVAEREGPVEELLAAYGISVVPTRPAASAVAALAAAQELGYPVAIKSARPNLRNRLDLGAVRLNLADPRALRRAYDEVAERFGPAVLVQPMVTPGVACVVEVVDFPGVGPAIAFGLGGIASDLLGDKAWRLAPVTDTDAAALVREPKASAMLQGYRGAPPVDLDALAELLVRVGQLADENPEVKRLTLNPVLANPTGLVVLHASVVYGEATPRPDTGPRQLSPDPLWSAK